MQQIKKEYIVLFNAITDAEETLRATLSALIAAQQQAEELYLESDSDEDQPSA